jgi:hypothetical protein
MASLLLCIRESRCTSLEIQQRHQKKQRPLKEVLTHDGASTSRASNDGATMRMHQDVKNSRTICI